MKYNKENTLEDLPSTNRYWGYNVVDNNGNEIYVAHRAMLFAWLQRGYYKINDEVGSLKRVIKLDG